MPAGNQRAEYARSKTRIQKSKKILPAMQVYDHPTFRMACQHFDLAADRLEIPQAERDRIKYP